MGNNFIDKQSLLDIGEELFRLRREKHLFLYQLAKQTGIPAKVIEGIEIGRYLKFRELRNLSKFYGKKPRIVFDKE